ncbi:hypothetical protein AVEN_133967-1 [Araneus ventricosus]|uniref:Uncharacterized protein n=1 Tax=Araneus ventricosus TaxID=182803 RepID=A0A4Y2J5K5_ARAVE|nr:hypothetical protein AVEN_133967-1 [Araneus ventricosus]
MFSPTGAPGPPVPPTGATPVPLGTPPIASTHGHGPSLHGSGSVRSQPEGAAEEGAFMAPLATRLRGRGGERGEEGQGQGGDRATQAAHRGELKAARRAVQGRTVQGSGRYVCTVMTFFQHCSAGCSRHRESLIRNAEDPAIPPSGQP